MLVTAAAQLRVAASIIFGLPFSLWSLDRLIEAMRDTRHEFGAIGPEGAELLGGPVLDEETRRVIQLRRFRTQAQRAARETAYYGRLFAQLGLDPSKLSEDEIQQLPTTPKDALRHQPDAFVRRTARPAMRIMTTGTTGWPTSIHFSAHELRLMVALSAMSVLMRREIDIDDILHIGISSRAPLGILGLGGACTQIGATAYVAGLIEPADTLALLAQPRQLPGKKPRASILSTVPSYLGQLVECGPRLGYRPADFGLERIFLGGEALTDGLKARCQRLFGPVQLIENYGMTETVPFMGQLCREGHLHFDPSHGLLEVLGLDTGRPAQPGELGTVVATPFAPYRETTLLLRYDTQDVVRPLDGPLTCDLRNLPATSHLLGKRRLSVRHAAGWTCQRDVVEALEAVETVPLPARYGFWAVPGGVAVEVLAPVDTPAVRREIAARLEERRVPLQELHLVDDPRHLRRPLPLRCDLREASFTSLGEPAELPLAAARASA